ncbi:MAG: hypothetical protein N3A59_01745 [Thermodesulfovibrionales bacterium]|nr:hypothetical protein [Thermodesulfovibrionales bacterium]
MKIDLVRLRRKEKYSSIFQVEEDIKDYFLPDIERAERLKEHLNILYELNRDIPILVEGKKDVEALRKLGFVGEILTVYSGIGLYEFCQNILEKYEKIVLLIDWDSNGEILYKKLSQYLTGLWEEFSYLREAIKAICQKDIRDVEDIPRLYKRLVGNQNSLKISENNSVKDW